MGIILYLFLLLFIVVGICDIFHSIYIRLILPRNPLKKIVICRLDNSEIDEQIEYLSQQYKWYGTKCYDKFICLCDKNDANLVNLKFSEEFTFIDTKDAFKIYDLLGEEYGLNFRHH